MSEAAHVESAYFVVPGQGSWNCPAVRRQPRLAQTVEALLRERPEFHDVRVNPWTGRVRLMYASSLEARVCVDIIDAAISHALSGPTRRAKLEPVPALRPRKTVSQVVTVPDAGQPSQLAPLLLIGGAGLGLYVVSNVLRRANVLFPRVAVRDGVLVWLASSAGLAWVNMRERDDQLKLKRKRAVRQLRRFARPYRGKFWRAQAANLASRVTTVATLHLIGAVVDAVIAPDKTAVIGRGAFARRVSLPQLGLILGGAIMASNALEYYSQRAFMHAAHQTAHDIRVELYEHIQSLEFRELAAVNRGVLLTLLNEDINRIVLLFSSLWMITRELGMSVAAMAGFYLHDPGVAGMVVTPLPSLILLGRRLESQIRERVNRTRELGGELGGQLSIALDGIETIRANSREQSVVDWVSDGSDAYREQLNSAVNLTAIYDPLAASAGHALRALTGFAIGRYAGAGKLSTGSYISLILMCGMITIPLRGIARDLPHILSTLASLSRVFEAFELETEDPYVGEPLDREQVVGDIEFRGVNFGYPSGTRVFEQFDVVIPAGKTTAFVGQTGSGKSTLAKLLLRFHDLDGGTITIDGRDISDYRRTDVRRSIAYVGQDIFLFNGTISQNIAFSEERVDRAKIVEVARIAEAHEFIQQLPQGYETVVGERGQTLSGGQRQRIGIARALYAPRPIVVLDEATSALDSVTESSLHDSLTRELAGRTVIVIAHRLSAVKNADRIYVLDDGEVVEAGSHDELLQREGSRYARFWALQTDD